MSVAERTKRALEVIERYGIQSVVDICFYANGDTGILISEPQELAKFNVAIEVSKFGGIHFSTHLTVTIEGMKIHSYKDKRDVA